MRKEFVKLIESSLTEIIGVHAAKQCAPKVADKLMANKAIILPGELGQKVYGVMTPCGGCPCFEEPMREEFIETCRKCEKAIVGELKFDYDLIPEWGKSVFATREEAEQALKERNDKHEMS